MSQNSSHFSVCRDAVGAFDRISVLVKQLHVNAIAVPRVGEEDKTLGIHGDIVRRVESLTFEAISQNPDGAVDFRSCHWAIAALFSFFTREETSLQIENQPIGMPGRSSFNPRFAGVIAPNNGIARYIREEDVTVRAPTLPP